MKKSIGLIAAAMLIAAGCGSDPHVPDDPTAMVGTVVGRDVESPISRSRINVFVKNEASCGVIFTIVENTVIKYRTSSGALRDATAAEVKLGERVSVWTDIIATSCPGQAIAHRIEILP